MSDPIRLDVLLGAATWTFEKATRTAADAQLREMIRALHALRWHPPEVPELVQIDQQTVAPREDWFERAWKRAKHEARCRWAPRDRGVMKLDLGVRIVSLVNVATQVGVPALVAGLATIPFTLGTLGHVFYGPQWEFPAEFFKTSGFPGAHGDFGLAAVFRGNGHDVLVSRRWLTHGGPWRVVRGPNDTTFVQFYDQRAKTPAIAWAQAKDGYPRLAAHYNGTTGFSGTTRLRPSAFPRTRPTTPKPRPPGCWPRIAPSTRRRCTGSRSSASTAR